jgi:hypothetical protein
VVFLLNREQAVSLISTINDESETLKGHSLLLMSPNENNILSKGYQVDIKKKIDAD